MKYCSKFVEIMQFLTYIFFVEHVITIIITIFLFIFVPVEVGRGGALRCEYIHRAGDCLSSHSRHSRYQTWVSD